MKKFFLSNILILCSVFLTQNTFGQLAEDQRSNIFSKPDNNTEARKVTFGLRTGLNINSISESDEFYSKYNSSRVSFNFGASLDVPIYNNFYFQSGLYFTNKGWNYAYKDFEYTFKLGYLQLPILASYQYLFPNGFRIQANTGFYLGLGVVGSADWEDAEDETSGSEKAFGDGEDNMGLNRFDFGWAFGAGITYKKVFFGLQYDLGITNIANHDAYDEDYSLRNRTFSINIGYNF